MDGIAASRSLDHSWLRSYIKTGIRAEYYRGGGMCFSDRHLGRRLLAGPDAHLTSPSAATYLHVHREVAECRGVFGWYAAPASQHPERFTGRDVGCAGSLKDRCSPIPDQLERDVRNARILIRLLEEKGNERPGKLERVRDVAARVFVDCLLPSRVEFLRAEGVVLIQEDLGCGHHHANGPSRLAQHPNRHGVIEGWPEQAHAVYAEPQRQKRVQGRELVAFRYGCGRRGGSHVDRLPQGARCCPSSAAGL